MQFGELSLRKHFLQSGIQPLSASTQENKDKTKTYLILRPAVSVTSLKVGQRCSHSGGDGHGRSDVLGGHLNKDGRDEGGDLVRERLDERADTENSRVCGRAAKVSTEA